MKKGIIAVAMSLVMSLGICGISFATEDTTENSTEKAIDFNEYSDDELLELSAMLNSVLTTRGLTDRKVNQLPTGTYSVGTDIPAGSYQFWQIPNDDYIATLYVYNNLEDDKYLTNGSADAIGCMLNLSEGQILKITWTGVMASKFSGDNMEW